MTIDNGPEQFPDTEAAERNSPIPLLFDVVAARLRDAIHLHYSVIEYKHLQFDRNPATLERTVSFGLAENFEMWANQQGGFFEVIVPVPIEDRSMEALPNLLTPDNPHRHFTIVWRNRDQEHAVKVTAAGIENYPAGTNNPDNDDDGVWDLLVQLSVYDIVPIRKERLIDRG